MTEDGAHGWRMGDRPQGATPTRVRPALVRLHALVGLRLTPTVAGSNVLDRYRSGLVRGTPTPVRTRFSNVSPKVC
jgi:hypothetical protein